MATAGPVTEPSRAGGYAWYVAALLATGHLVSFIDRFLMSLLMEPLKADLGVSDAQLGLLQGTGFVILYTVVAVPLGRMADRMNRRNLIIAGMVLWSLATAACGLAGSFGSLFLARVGVGFGEAALVPAAMSLLAAYFPRRQLGRAVSLFTTGASLGKSAALIGGGAVLAAVTATGGMTLAGIGHLLPWQATFVIMAAPGFVLALLMLSVREPARTGTAAGAAPDFAATFSYLRQHRAAYATHTVAATIVVLLVQTIAAWMPSFYVRFFAMTPPQAGLVVGGIVLLAAPLGHISGGMLTDLFQSRQARSPAAPVIVVGLLGAIPCVLLFATSRDLATSVVAAGLLNFFLTLASPATLAGVQMLTPDRLRGVVTSMFLATVTLIGIGCGPAMIGLLTDTLGGPDRLGQSLLIAVPILALSGAALALASRPPFGRTAAAAIAAH
ncbi:MFS transporter [Rhizorhabdus wittichii]|uniref:MFS transporter n=1 Tax=Rhizorhabdus wittichii TaxID=160791 RepID=A0A975HCB9_9SPHN|nr:MFS transporter [Rhizorhabdus wittichii]